MMEPFRRVVANRVWADLYSRVDYELIYIIRLFYTPESPLYEWIGRRLLRAYASAPDFSQKVSIIEMLLSQKIKDVDFVNLLDGFLDKVDWEELPLSFIKSLFF